MSVALCGGVPLLSKRAWIGERRLYVAGLAALLPLLCVFLYYECSACLLRQYDDAYITFRYARNLALGEGLVFNPGELTDSASSFSFTLMLAAAYALGVHNLPAVALVIGLFGAAGTAAVVALACIERTGRPALAVFMAAAATCHGLISGWAVSGMETLFFTLLAVLAVYRLFVVYKFGWAETLLVALITLTRMEGLLLAAAWGGLALARLLGARDRETKRRIVLQLSLVAGVFAAFLAYKYAIYGRLVPHAFELKRVTALYAPKPQALWNTWSSLASGLLALGVAGLAGLPWRREHVALAAYVLLSITSLIWGPFADWVRYSVHLLPVFAILGSVPLAKLWRHVPALALIACGLMLVQAQRSFVEIRRAMQLGQKHAACREDVGRYLEANFPKGTTVVSSDIGAIAYAAPSIRFIDTVGLTSGDILEARARGESPEPLLFAKQPTVVADTCERGCRQGRDFSANAWLTRPRYWRTPLPDHEHYLDHLSRGKLLYHCQTPDRLWFGVTQFVRE